MQLNVGIESINSYKRLSYTVWFALAEFVDNSTQSFFDNQATLDPVYEQENAKLTVSIYYDKEKRTLTISDTSIGMSREELESALLIAAKAPRNGGRSRYGMGLKTAACWFGDEWTIETKKLGEKEAIKVTVNVPAIAESGDGNLKPESNGKVDEAAHYTVLTISKLHRRFSAATINNVRLYLGSIYRRDIEKGRMLLSFQGTPLSWYGLGDFRMDGEGKPYYKELSLDIAGRKITGWVGVLAAGSRRFGGFSLLQNDRVIRGYPTAWKPQNIFGQEEGGSNDLVNQRLCGELNVDGFQVSHTKEDISWQDDEQELLEDALAEECKLFRVVARDSRNDSRLPDTRTVDETVTKLTQELSSGALVNALELEEAPPEEVLEKTSKVTMAVVARENPRINVMVGSLRVKVYFDYDARPESYYYNLDIEATERAVSVAINQHHPYLVTLGSTGYEDFVRQCVYDAITQYKASAMGEREPILPHTFRHYKDNLLRTSYKINDEVNHPRQASPDEPSVGPSEDTPR